MDLKDLDVYKLAREISDEVWLIYEKLGWQDKKIFGDQFITAIDSIGSNIAEGFGRFHYLDKINLIIMLAVLYLNPYIGWIFLRQERRLQRVNFNLWIIN